MKENPPKMLWVSQEVFWNWADKAGVPIDYRGWCVFHTSEEELKKRIGTMPPNQDVSGEDDPPGPVSRWYGSLEGIPILLDLRHGMDVGPSVVLRHGEQAHARARVREFFKTWGRDWEESQEPFNS